MRFSRRTLFLGAAAGGLAGAQPGPSGAVGRRFQAEALREIAFPLGGIGTGTVSLGGYGDLRDWEIFNRPNKGSILPYTFAALRIAGGGLKEPAAKVLEREVLPPFPESHGIGRERAAGLPRFREAVFVGGYPVASIFFQDPKWPVEVSLEAFNPMVPLETEQSSLPVAILIYSTRSRAAAPLDASLAFSIMNPVGYDGTKLASRRAACFGRNINEFRSESGANGLFLHSDCIPPESFRYGSLALATDAAEVSYRPRWEHGALWDELPAWWRDFCARGRFAGGEPKPSDTGFTEYASLAAHFALAPGETRRTAFVLSWHFPNIEDYWTGLKPYYGHQEVRRLIRNEYGTRWKSAWEPAIHTIRNLSSLRERTLRYRDTLYASTLPPEVIDAVSSQASIIRTNTLLVEEGGRALAFEGCGDDQGCCPMNCTHVFNYEQSLAHLYPDLERSMRETDFLQNLREDGYMSFRTATPVQHGAYTKHPAADGQMGTILKLYREWMLSGDDAWLRRLWPHAKRALEFAWVDWDPDRDGVMEGEQHNTYDVRFYGANSMVGSLYLGALAAAARMARHLGDNAAAEQYEAVFQKGSRELDRQLWNGRYYIQKTDPKQIWQFGEGCLADQLVGQWFAEVVDLDALLPREHVREALRSVYRNNFREDFHEFASGQRIYALNDEQGLVICTWPDGKRPLIPFGYCDEVWTGIEYEVAAHLIYEGMVREGTRMVRAVRERYNGARRNPWDEVECGHHYARAMSSWSLLTAFSGFAWSAPSKALRFRPASTTNEFRCLFSTGVSWGSYEQRAAAGGMAFRIRVEGGVLELSTLRVPAAGNCTLDAPFAAVCRRENDLAVVTFREAVKIKQGGELALALR